jgi:hypothetical protein
VRAVPLGDLGEARRQDLGALEGQPCSQLGLFQSSLELDYRIGVTAEASQVSAGGEAKQMGGGEGGAEGEALGGLVEFVAQVEVNGRAGIGRGELLRAEARRVSWPADAFQLARQSVTGLV